MRATVVIALLMAVPTARALDLNLQANFGRCSSADYLEMCSEGRNVWRLSWQYIQPITPSLSTTVDLIHYSSWDGPADTRGDVEHQSGIVNFAGLGLEYHAHHIRAGLQYGAVKDSVGLFDGPTHHAYVSVEQPLDLLPTGGDGLVLTADDMGPFQYVGLGLVIHF